MLYNSPHRQTQKRKAMLADVRNGRGTILHWGPLIAISLISVISVSTTFVSLEWMPPERTLGGAVNICAFLLWVTVILYNLFASTYNGPGYVPLKWTPDIEDPEKNLQFCTECEGFKAPRSHHCRKCQRCVMKMDHHCPWVNNCVGHRNHFSFLLFTFFCPVGCTHGFVVMCTAVYQYIYYEHYQNMDPNFIFVNFTEKLFILVLLSLGLCLGVMVAVFCLFFIQLKAIFRNETAVENWIRSKAEYRREKNVDLAPFVYPYDIGRWRNLRMIVHLRFRPDLDGFQWPVTDGCTQYTFTIEQLRQKENKKNHAIPHTAIHKFSGSLCPLYSEGLRTFFGCPCTDEPRIALTPGDMVVVTRWKKLVRAVSARLWRRVDP